MSRRAPIEIEVSKKLKVRPELVFESEVVKAGTGAVIKAYKRFLGKKVIVIVKEGEK